MYDVKTLNKRCRTEWIELINEWVHNEKDRQMLIRHMLDGVCYEKLAEEVELSATQCYRRTKSAERQLFKNIKK